MKITHVVGARPNFMKAAPVIAALTEHSGVAQLLVHTGQHYDANMSMVFFEELNIPTPDANLDVGSGRQSAQTAEIMVRFDDWLDDNPTDLVVVYGDVNSTLAAALVCAKRQLPIAHVEAGLRSFDWSMPEEANRVLTDRVADFLLTPSTDADENLRHEGLAEEKIHFVGNVMIDTLVRLLPKAESRASSITTTVPPEFALATLHRPSNVDDPQSLTKIMSALDEVAQRLPVIFPIHPRTRARLERLKLDHSVTLLDPVGYLDFLALQTRAVCLITDSGGIQEETTYLGIPCLTLRGNTERPITVTVGTNEVVGDDPANLHSPIASILEGRWKRGEIPKGWDGKASERIAEVLLD